MNIYLCGFMGCGKSTVGKLLAEKLSMEFIDMDEAIENFCGMTIPEIFSSFGEEGFRERETEICRRLSERDSLIVACGGGAVLRNKNVDIIKNKGGHIVFLRVPEENLIKRLRSDPTPRPVIKDKNDGEILEIYRSRLPKYISAAEIIVDCCENPEENAERIIISIKGKI